MSGNELKGTIVPGITPANSIKMGGALVPGSVTFSKMGGIAHVLSPPQIVLTTWNHDKLKRAVAQFYNSEGTDLYLSFKFEESHREMENKFLDLRNRCDGLNIQLNILAFHARDSFERLYGRLENYDSTDEAIEVLLNAFIQYKLKQ